MTPKERAQKLSSIPLDDSHRNHAWLRECFNEELKYRLDEDESEADDYEHFENIYH